MEFSNEFRRFVSDHISPEARRRFVEGLSALTHPSELYAAIKAKGYDVSEAEVAAVPFPKLSEEQLNKVAGGSGGDISGLNYNFAMQFHMQIMSQYIETVSNTLGAVHNEMIT
jgi:hypothetical protein